MAVASAFPRPPAVSSLPDPPSLHTPRLWYPTVVWEGETLRRATVSVRSSPLRRPGPGLFATESPPRRPGSLRLPPYWTRTARPSRQKRRRRSQGRLRVAYHEAPASRGHTSRHGLSWQGPAAAAALALRWKRRRGRGKECCRKRQPRRRQ
jgi:hypothetical protein